MAQQGRTTTTGHARPSRIDLPVAIGIALMLAMVAFVAFGDLGPAQAYAAVPM